MVWRTSFIILLNNFPSMIYWIILALSLSNIYISSFFFQCLLRIWKAYWNFCELLARVICTSCCNKLSHFNDSSSFCVSFGSGPPATLGASFPNYPQAVSSHACPNQYWAEDLRKKLFRLLELSLCTALSSLQLCPENASHWILSHFSDSHFSFLIWDLGPPPCSVAWSCSSGSKLGQL